MADDGTKEESLFLGVLHPLVIFMYFVFLVTMVYVIVRQPRLQQCVADTVQKCIKRARTLFPDKRHVRIERTESISAHKVFFSD
jgi:hypothetical protein